MIDIYDNSLLITFTDSVYSERYMGKPDLSGNFKGYQDSDIMQKVRYLRPTEDTMRKVRMTGYSRLKTIHIIILLYFTPYL